MADRTASVTWSGSLTDGAGRIESVGSGAFGPLDVTWASRTEEPGGARAPKSWSQPPTRRAFRWRSRTRSPRRLAAGAARDVGDGDVRARHRDHEERAPRARHRAGDGRGRVPRGGRGCETGCPVSKALAAVPEITLDAALV